MDKVDPDNPTIAERKSEEEKFKAVMFLKQSDKGRHGKLLTDLQDGAYVGRMNILLCSQEHLIS